MVVPKMNFRTEIAIPEFPVKIEHDDMVLTLGSCFAENISGYFADARFNIMENPFGVLYNPASIFNSVKLVSDNKKFTEDDLIHDQDEYHSFYHHSDFSHHDADTVLAGINKGISSTRAFLKTCEWVIISYGTAYVFRHKKENVIVSNCHKISPKQFERYRLSVKDVINYTHQTIELLRGLNEKVKVILTVSPVRHIRDGLTQNQLSKSTLHLAVDEMVRADEYCFYFPSYEIVMDDLRDYRFYDKDMVHPNKLATDYIWEKFSGVCLSKKCGAAIKEFEKLNRAVNHRPRNAESEKHKQFAKEMLNYIEGLEERYPHVNLERDRTYFEKVI